MYNTTSGWEEEGKKKKRRKTKEPKLRTIITVIINQNNLFEQVSRSPVNGWMNGAQNHREGFINKYEYNADLRKPVRKRKVSAPEEKHKKRKKSVNCWKSRYQHKLSQRNLSPAIRMMRASVGTDQKVPILVESTYRQESEQLVPENRNPWKQSAESASAAEPWTELTFPPRPKTLQTRHKLLFTRSFQQQLFAM